MRNSAAFFIPAAIVIVIVALFISKNTTNV
jgi:hypothetical protein